MITKKLYNRLLRYKNSKRLVSVFYTANAPILDEWHDSVSIGRIVFINREHEFFRLRILFNNKIKRYIGQTIGLGYYGDNCTKITLVNKKFFEQYFVDLL